MDFGDRLKQFRIKEGLSQEQLADKIGVSRQAITKWETKKGMPDIENMVILAEIFKLTLDELVLQESKVLQEREAEVLYESETIYDIDCDKHFDIHMGSVRKIKLTQGTDEKIHIKLESDCLEELGSLYKIKLDEKKNKLDIDCVNKKGISRYEAEESVDVVISLPKDYTNHCELGASTKELYIENLNIEQLEYDGEADSIFVKNTVGSLEFTAKSDYEISIEGICTQIDVNQWHAKTVIHVPEIEKYTVINKGCKCGVYYQKDGVICKEPVNANGENVISISGIFSELIVDALKYE